jgi:ribosomal protein S18 acetylase RimI-like enzyme
LEITLRRAGASDVPAVAAITNAAYAKWIDVIGRKPMPMTVDYAVAITHHLIDLAQYKGVPVALIEMIDKGDYLMIENLAVLPQHQGQGIGRMLLEQAEIVAKALKLPVIRLLTNGKFASNIELYRRNQYTVDREEPFKAGTIVHMSKNLLAII